MAGGWNVGWDLQNAFASVTSGTPYTQTSAAGYSAWQQIVAATPSDMTWMLLTMQNPYGGRATLMDIATGASGSEVAMISSLALTDQGTNTTYGCSLLLPFPAPAGTRIAARAGSAAASNGVVIQVIGLDDSFGSAPSCCSQYDTYGTVAASYHGTAVDPGATAGTAGAWVQLTASCANDYGGFFLMFDSQGAASGSSGTYINFAVDVGIGAAGSEKVILPRFGFGQTNGGYVVQNPSNTPYIPIEIPSGSRIAVRAAADSAASPDRVFGVSFYGARQ